MQNIIVKQMKSKLCSWGFYIMSMMFLFAILLIKSIDIPMYWGEDWEFVGWKCLLNIHIILPLICLILIVAGLLFYKYFKILLSVPQNHPITVKEIKNISTEQLSFIISYLLPLVSFSVVDVRNILILLIILVLIGFIFIKTDLCYKNPTLAIFGYKLFKINGSFGNLTYEHLVITRDNLNTGDMYTYITLNNNFVYALRQQ